MIRLGLKEQKRKELYAKQGRGSQFTSRDQRDTWIQNELKSLSKAIKEKNEQIERLQEDLKVISMVDQFINDCKTKGCFEYSEMDGNEWN